MGIINGELADADEVMNTFGRLFKNVSQTILNAELIGIDSNLDKEYLNLKYDTLQNSTYIDTTNSQINDVPVFPAIVLDDFEDGSIDTNIWSTSGSVSEGGGKLTLSGNSATATADQVSSFDFNTQSTIMFVWDTTTDSNPDRRFSLFDGSTNVDLHQNTTTVTKQYVRIVITPGSNQAVVRVGDQSVLYSDTGGTTIDLTSLNDGNDWSLRFYNGGTNPGSQSIYFVRYLANSAVSRNFISVITPSISTITNAILCVNSDTTIGTLSYSLSADGGSNFESVTENEIHRFTNTGTQLKVKADMTSGTDKVPVFNQYTCMYNWYD